MTREEQLKREYDVKLAALHMEQAGCDHVWLPVKYDPEIRMLPVYKDRFIGVDYMPELVGHNKKEEPRWSRTCTKCGKVEYTKECIATAFVPKF